MEVLHIVKAGGKVISDAEKLSQFLKGFQALPSPKILVHGGGKPQRNWLKNWVLPYRCIREDASRTRQIWILL